MKGVAIRYAGPLLLAVFSVAFALIGHHGLCTWSGLSAIVLAVALS